MSSPLLCMLGDANDARRRASTPPRGDKRQRVVTYDPQDHLRPDRLLRDQAGLHGEMRRTGRSVVAVVWCDKK